MWSHEDKEPLGKKRRGISSKTPKRFDPNVGAFFDEGSMKGK